MAERPLKKFAKDGSFRPSRVPPPPVRVVLDNIRSAFNAGSIIRTCEAAGVEHLYLCGITAAPPNPKVLKTALGAEQSLSWSHHLDVLEVVSSLHDEGFQIVSVEQTSAGKSYTEVDYAAQKVAFVFGHEVMGVAQSVLDRSDLTVEIPMYGRKNSLNVATAAGVVLFESLRQRILRLRARN